MAVDHFAGWVAEHYDESAAATVDFTVRGGWHRESFTSERRSHVSIWGKPA
jgi:hypothetical protein